MKFLHTADWQIGRGFDFEGDGEGHDPAAALAQARFDVVATIARLASAEGVEAVLVAGDVFDKPALADHTLRRTIHAMAGFTGRWVLLPGNHDAALAESVWTRLQRLDLLPDNVDVLLEPGVRAYADHGFAILAAPLTQRQTHEDLSEWFDQAQTPAGLLRIGLAHGSVAGVLPESADSPNPIAPDRASSARLDYLALGDWHGTRQIDARTWYSGTPEPERFKDNDPGNVLLVEIDAPGAVPRVTPRRVARFRWHERSVEVRGSADVERLCEDLGELGGGDVLRLHVAGMADLATNEQLRLALDAARARLHVLQADLSGLQLEPTAADLAALKVDGALAEVVAELRDLQTQAGQAALANEALKLLFDLVRREGLDA
ncbi:metallophosphoesterase family protein [Dokdonella sp.]|uniref:metallophosphoesterase family protein n=1 Tax=Dokdonella sp. TaxID=2291710 RepID=UPI0031C800BD|nr:DNA repair exonuclease [Dokdonella sp.]